jgi:hypothetical protein
MLAAIATMDPVVLPTQADFEHMLTEMAAPDTQVAPEG